MKYLKRKLALLTSLVLVITSLVGCNNSADSTSSSGTTNTTTNNAQETQSTTTTTEVVPISSEDFILDGTTLVKYIGENSVVQVPENITAIATGAFSKCIFITEIILPETVSIIGANAFENCTRLEKINIPSAVTTIYDQTFFGCKSLQSIQLPDSIERIGEQAFAYCVILNDIKLPQNITVIENSTFSNCYSLTKIELPTELEIIQDSAFRYSGLNYLDVPTGVHFLGEGAFYGCHKLKSITLPETLKYISSYAFQACFELADISIPSSVEYIGAGAFIKCYALTEISIPEGITSIEEFTFDYCYNLVSIDIPESLKEIKYRAFTEVSGLMDFEFPSTVVYDKDQVFVFSYDMYESSTPPTYDLGLDEYPSDYDFDISNDVAKAVLEYEESEKEESENESTILTVPEQVEKYPEYMEIIQDIVSTYGLYTDSMRVGLQDFELFDINNDGIDELVIGYSTSREHQDSVVNIYTMDGTTPKIIFENGYDDVCFSMRLYKGYMYFGGGMREETRLLIDGEFVKSYYAQEDGLQAFSDFYSEINELGSHSSNHIISEQETKEFNYAFRKSDVYYDYIIGENGANVLLSNNSSVNLNFIYQHDAENTKEKYSDYSIYYTTKPQIDLSNEVAQIVYDKYSDITQYIVDNLGFVSQTSDGVGVYDVVLADIDGDLIDELIIVYKQPDNSYETFDIDYVAYTADIEGNVYGGNFYGSNHFNNYTFDVVTKFLDLKIDTDSESIEYYKENLLEILGVYDRGLEKIDQYNNYSNFSITLENLNLFKGDAQIYLDYLKDLTKEYDPDISFVEFYDIDTNSTPTMLFAAFNYGAEVREDYYSSYDNADCIITYYTENGINDDFKNGTFKIREVDGVRYLVDFQEVWMGAPFTTDTYYTLSNGNLQKAFDLNFYHFSYDINNSDVTNGAGYNGNLPISSAINGVSYNGLSNGDYGGYMDKFDDFNCEGFNYKKISELEYSGPYLPYIAVITGEIFGYWGTTHNFSLYADTLQPFSYNVQNEQLLCAKTDGAPISIMNCYTINDVISHLEKMV